jgi:AmmeMemoRadiSam system protein B
MSLFERLFKKKPVHTRPLRAPGHLYHAEPEALRAATQASSSRGQELPAGSAGRLRALIVPFAEQVMMHEVCQPAWRAARAARLRRVVTFAPALRIPLQGLALPSYEAFESPLGPLLVERALLDKLASLPELARIHDPAHLQELTIEALLPYLQVYTPDAQHSPILLGDGAIEATSYVLDELVELPDTLLVVATELSTELSAEEADELDAQTAEAICALDDGALTPRHASCRQGVVALLRVARRYGWRAQMFARGSSAEVSGERAQVVGYGAFGLFEPA